MFSSFTISELREQLRLISEALAATRRAIIISSATGSMMLCTEPAERCLEQYFESPTVAKEKLPEKLREWMSRYEFAPAGNGHPPASLPPLIVDCPAGRLTVHLVASQNRDHRLLILEEDNATPCAARLESQLGLTAREAEVLFWVAQGKMNAGIAILLGLKTATVEKHLEHILAKLKVETRTAAASCAHEVFSGQRIDVPLRAKPAPTK